MLAALLNVTGWMVLMGLALLWLPASEAALIAYTMPVWASLLAWPVLGERPTWLRTIALVMAFAGLAVIMGGNGFSASAAKLPGILMALTRRHRLCARHGARQETAAATAADPGRGLADRARLFAGRGGRPSDRDHASRQKSARSAGWLLAYSILIQFCIAYVSWFAALARLPASVAAIGTMAVPVIGVVASAFALHEPLGLTQIVALAFTLAGVVLATRS